ncbi:S8 family serine peptidase [Virgibacillus sp. 179-BFC.A HS]|uniref:S8 family serine peptidase n=1 Tax=Tigheibacillus jepli TaxID=3035914 RepID=A0ABU5CH02_9BACI|nr:S8 family serine peptidase [Virgibacillus sp. 179-BFC.A HS]MDY0404828.1 S8 family serine peptidase [Virgibacillus sp. 179-BFC.A HS]
MKNRTKHLIGKQIARLIILAMIFVLLLPANVTDAKTASKKGQESSMEKLDTRLQEAFKKKDVQRYIVILKEQVDTGKVALQARQRSANQSLSAAKTKKNVQQAVVSSLQKQAKGTQKGVLSYLKQDKQNIKAYQSFFIVNGVAVTGTKMAAQKIAAMPEVKTILLDEKQHIISDKNDKNVPEEGAVEWNIDRVGATDVWKKGITGENAVVANIDSGVVGEHPALKRQYRGYNPDDPEHPSNEFNWHDAVFDRKSPADSDGHGTHTMGTMVGRDADGQHNIGVAPGAKWIAARAFYGDEGYDSYILEAAQWVLAPTDENGEPHPEKAPDVVNNSWGGSPINNDWFLPMVKAWRSVGIIPVFSIGNTGWFDDADPGSASAPGNYKEVIGVGATDENDALADFSLRGPSEDGAVKPDITAPGVNIRSSWPGATWDQFSYRTANGTSMAAPHVAAAVSLMKQVDDTLTVEQIEDILKLTALRKTDDAYPDMPNNGYGYGLLDVKAAVDAVQKGIGNIDGQITAAGEDKHAPTYKHDVRKALFIGRDENFSIQVTDDVSVDHVTLHMKKKGQEEKTYSAKRIAGDHFDGTYEAVVPKKDVEGESITYWWVMKDFSGKQTTSEMYTVPVKEGVSAGYKEDFEGFPDGWYSYGTYNSWEWGVPEYGPDKAASGKKVMGTNLRGLYAADADMTLVMPPVLVSDQTTLRFKNWYKLGSLGQDIGTVFISKDNETWEPLYQVRLSNERWHEIGIDLSEYAGEKVTIAFHLSTGSESAGWYLDDVALVDTKESSTKTKKLFDQSAEITTAPKAKKDYPYSLDRTGREITSRSQLPVQATVTVKETGWQVKTNPQNGKFSIHHPPGTYTLQIDAYGYEPVKKSVTLTGKGTISPAIQMQALPKQKLSGQVISSSGKKIANATIFILGDEKSKPVKTDSNGNYELDIYEGKHTIKVYAADYIGKTETVEIGAGKDLRHDFQLDRFEKSVVDEIKYDNGSYGKNLAFGKKGNGFAVRMSLAEGKEMVMVTGAKLQFWADHVPKPGGEDILIAVYDAKGPDGSPGNKLAGPIHAKAKRDLYSWTQVDLSDLGIVVDGDFYIAYLQADNYPYIPGFVSDGDSQHATGRSWDYIGGQWFHANESYGNYMIRADVAYGEASTVVRPEITTPEDGMFTNEENITVEGTAAPDATIQLLVNGEEAMMTDADSAGQFFASVPLAEGENELLAVMVAEDGLEYQSEPVTVILDTKRPTLTIDSPQDGDVLTKRKVMVKGKTADEHIHEVKVNGKTADLTKDGKYAAEMILETGEQNIVVTAIDQAENTTTKRITVVVNEKDDDDGALKIEHLTPEEDVNLEAGESVKIAFDSKPGLRATFAIFMPLTNVKATTNAAELPMMETENGHYVGYWTATKNVQTEGAVIEVKVTDRSGRQAYAKAKGKLYINVK